VHCRNRTGIQRVVEDRTQGNLGNLQQDGVKPHTLKHNYLRDGPLSYSLLSSHCHGVATGKCYSPMSSNTKGAIKCGRQGNHIRSWTDPTRHPNNTSIGTTWRHDEVYCLSRPLRHKPEVGMMQGGSEEDDERLNKICACLPFLVDIRCLRLTRENCYGGRSAEFSAEG
jgi:hypothetical protein